MLKIVNHEAAKSAAKIELLQLSTCPAKQILHPNRAELVAASTVPTNPCLHSHLQIGRRKNRMDNIRAADFKHPRLASNMDEAETYASANGFRRSFK